MIAALVLLATLSGWEAGPWLLRGQWGLLVLSCRALLHLFAGSPTVTWPWADASRELPINPWGCFKGNSFSITVSNGFSSSLCYDVCIALAPWARDVHSFNLPQGSCYWSDSNLVLQHAYYWVTCMLLSYTSSLKDWLFQCGFLPHVLPA